METSTPILTANTGKNDTTSIWSSGLFNLLGSAINTGGNIFTTLGQTQTQKDLVKAQTKANAAQQSGTSRLIIFGIIGVVVLAVIVIVIKRR